MEIRLETVLGSAEVGLFALSTDKYLLVSKQVNPSKRRLFEEVLKTEAVAISLSDSILLSPFAAGNSNGLILTGLTLVDEFEAVRRTLKEINVIKLASKHTAVGNLILCNDKGALVSPVLGRAAVKTVGEVLGVEAAPGTLAGRTYIGSLAVATNSGAMVHIEASEEEIELVESVLKVEAEPGTVNGGLRFLRSSIVANSWGVVAGARTTGPELMTISRVFQR
ncbi:MAG: translation initiation factor IF-6 [Candidatus Caldarchaeum sp.]|nr:translation initiation factor IF-6 [Candidatus Caldarchaeum sp.]MDW8359784.1 translation initiation factor IF-6 [Candidatus Caldarchaeum sp.]